jgi:hypothetical protein
MVPRRSAAVSVQIHIPVAKLVDLVNAGKLHAYELTFGELMMTAPLGIEREWQPIMVSRESERVHGDGWVVFLPPEPDHGPDDWIELPRRCTAFGASVTRETFDELLDAAAPDSQDAVDALRTALAQLDARGGVNG